MATAVRRRAQYETNGSAAYAPAYAPERRRQGEELPLVRPRERVQARPRVLVREAGQVSPFAVVGFLAVGVFAALLLMSYARLAMIGDGVVHLRNELGQLQEENVRLLTQFELAYDLKEIEAAVTSTGAMGKPQAGQTVVLDLSEPDSVVTFAKEDEGNLVQDALGGIGQAAGNVAEYFH